MKPLLVALVSAGSLLVGLPTVAQDEGVSLGQAKRIFHSNDSHLRHETWVRINAENSSHYDLLVVVSGVLVRHFLAHEGQLLGNFSLGTQNPDADRSWLGDSE